MLRRVFQNRVHEGPSLLFRFNSNLEIYSIQNSKGFGHLCVLVHLFQELFLELLLVLAEGLSLALDLLHVVLRRIPLLFLSRAVP